MELISEDVVKIVFAIVVGGVIGAEREYQDKSAGFRTIIFICVGSTLFTMFSIKIANNSDPGRIAAQIVSGVGFLGAGAILRDHGRVVGLTTAAMIWLAAALGMGIGSGNYVLSGVGGVVAMIVLWIFPPIEQWIDSMRGTERYEIVTTHSPGRYEELLTLAHEKGLKIMSSKCNKVNDHIVVTMVLRGSPSNQAALSTHLLNDPGVKEFRH